MATRAEVRHWPVVAWIRLRVPEPDAPMLLTGGPPPPTPPPLDLLEPEAVATDPTVRLYTYHEPHEGGVIRYVWTAADATALTVELRRPEHVAHLAPEAVRRFWAAVKNQIAEIGPLPVEAADPRP